MEKDIDRAARGHVAQYKQYGGAEYESRDMENEFIDGYTTGAQSRQPEIDELIQALEEFHNLLEEHLPMWYLRKHHIKASQLLKRYKNEKDSQG